MPERLELSKDEVAAVIDYVFWHCRATKGTGAKVYRKMQDFLTNAGPKQGAFEWDKKDCKGRGK